MLVRQPTSVFEMIADSPPTEHCIDILRMSLMCFRDATVISQRWDENRGSSMRDFEAVHTCWDYNSLKTWSLARDPANPEPWPKNAERMNAERGNAKSQKDT